MLAEGMDFSREFIIKAEWRVKPKNGNQATASDLMK